MTFSLYHCLSPRDKTACLHFMELMLQAVPIREHTKCSIEHTYLGWPHCPEPGSPRSPRGAWTVPCQAHFQAHIRDAHRNQATSHFGNTDNPSWRVQAEKLENQPHCQNPMLYPSLPVIPEHHCVFEHVTHWLSLFIQQRMSLKNNELFPSRPALS